MNKTAYMNALRLALEGLPASVIEETMWIYEGKFVDAMAAGKSEEEVAAALPKAELVAAQKKAGMRYQNLKNNFTVGNIASLLVALIGLMFFNLFMLIPAITYFCLLCSGYVLALALYVAGIGITAASLSGVEQFNFDVPAGAHSGRHTHHGINGKLLHQQVRVDITESGILIDGEKLDEDAKFASNTELAAASSVAVSTTEHGSEKLHIEVGNHFSGTRLASGLGLLLGSILLMMLSMFMTKYTFIGFKHYLRWNLSQLQLVRPVRTIA